MDTVGAPMARKPPPGIDNGSVLEYRPDAAIPLAEMGRVGARIPSARFRKLLDERLSVDSRRFIIVPITVRRLKRI